MIYQMWVEIRKDIFETADFKGLNFLIQLLTWHPSDSIPRYNIFVNSEKINHLDNYKNLAEIDKKLIETEFDEAITSGVKKGKYQITNKNKHLNHFKIEEALMFLNQPTYIVIENSLNDSYFLKTIFYYFDDDKILTEFIKNNWIEFVNAGGWSNINNYIEGKLSSYDTLAKKYQKEDYAYLRCFVMVDSDKTYPSENVTDKEQLKIDLEAKNIKVHILKKRAMENYMPDEVIDSLPSKGKGFRQFKGWVETYKRLTPDQKNYLNYKDGFTKGKKSRSDLDINIQNLYPIAQINDADFAILDKGLQQLPKRFKSYFPTLFKKNYLVHKSSLLNREGGTSADNEFLEIIATIKSLL